jgi:hypothetical protein
MVVIPNVGGFATFAPRLDPLGNSARGLEFVKLLNKRFSFHFLDFTPSNDHNDGGGDDDDDNADAAVYPQTQRTYRDQTVALCSYCATGGRDSSFSRIARG